MNLPMQYRPVISRARWNGGRLLSGIENSGSCGKGHYCCASFSNLGVSYCMACHVTIFGHCFFDELYVCATYKMIPSDGC